MDLDGSHSDCPNGSHSGHRLWDRLCQAWTGFGPFSSRTFNAVAYKDTPDNYVLTQLWQQFDKGPHLSVTFGCPHTSGPIPCIVL